MGAPSLHAELANLQGCTECGTEDTQEGFGPRTCLMCSSCNLRFSHVECCERARGISISADATRSDTTWFCSPSCQRVHDEIDGLVAKLEPLADERRLELLPAGTAGDRGAKLRRDGSAQREAALKILQSAFEPLEMDNGRNLIEMCVFAFETPDDEVESGSDEGGAYDFSAFRVFVLRAGRTIICAATVRIFGDIFAEIPFVGTREDYRHQGALRTLFTGIELVLTELGVRHLVVASIKPLKGMWRDKFGFTQMVVGETDLMENLVVYPEEDTTVMMLKALGKASARSAINDTAAKTSNAIRARLQDNARSKQQRAKTQAKRSPRREVRAAAVAGQKRRKLTGPDADDDAGRDSASDQVLSGSQGSATPSGSEASLQTEADAVPRQATPAPVRPRSDGAKLCGDPTHGGTRQPALPQTCARTDRMPLQQDWQRGSSTIAAARQVMMCELAGVHIEAVRTAKQHVSAKAQSVRVVAQSAAAADGHRNGQYGSAGGASREACVHMLSLGILGAGVANRSPAGFESSSVMLDPPRTPDAMLAARKDRETVETLAQTIQDIKADTAEAVHATEIASGPEAFARELPQEGVHELLRLVHKLVVAIDANLDGALEQVSRADDIRNRLLSEHHVAIAPRSR